ncbi:MAG: site-specific integrase [Candidatus Bathyarchaeia archaeon]
MKYKTLVIEKSIRGKILKKPLTIKVPEQQNAAEKKLLDYVLESLNQRSCLIPFTLENFSTRNLARYLLFSRTGSQNSLYGYAESVYHFSKWIGAQPDQLLNKCQKRNGDTNPKGIARMTRALDEYVDFLQANNFSPNSIRSYLKGVIALFNVNCVGLRMAYGLSTWNVYEGRAPSREEIQKILDLADLRDRVIITILAVSGLRVGTLLKLQYQHVKHDIERDIVPIHVHVEAELTKNKRRSYDTFLNDEASDCLRSYIEARIRGTQKIPREELHDESPLIRAKLCKQVKTVTVGSVQSVIHDLYVKAGLLENNSLRRRYELRTHSFRKFFRTQMASLDVDRDCIDYMMGRRAKDRYHDIGMKGVEYLRGVYLNSRISIRAKVKMNKIDALKEIVQAWGLNPEKILTNEALAQLTSTTEKKPATDRDLLFWLKPLQNHQSNGFSPESSGAHK